MKRWGVKEEKAKHKELHYWYVSKNKTIGEVGEILGIAEQTVYKRMMRLGIKSDPKIKATYIAKPRGDIKIPNFYSPALAEFFGIMLGDGKLSYYQVIVTLGTKELKYSEYVVDLIQNLFGARPKIGIRKNGYKDVYLGSIVLTSWLKNEGLVYNKVLSQVGAPKWIFNNSIFLEKFLKGLFDTDGSIYKLKFGVQISFKNKSMPLLKSIERALKILGYRPSKVSADTIYLVRTRTFWTQIMA